MTAAEKVLLHLANALVAGTGAVYAVMAYLLPPAEEWAVVNHPWQPHVQHLHVLAAPALVFAVGVLWGRHVLPHLRNGGTGRRSGVGLLVGFAPMVVSGALIQTAVDPGWRGIWVAVHLAASGLWLAALAMHVLSRRPAGETAAAEAGSAVRERTGRAA